MGKGVGFYGISWEFEMFIAAHIFCTGQCLQLVIGWSCLGVGPYFYTEYVNIVLL
jgi:hypothetical protein